MASKLEKSSPAKLTNSPSMDESWQERDAPPTHYSFKIQSFSILSKASIEKYSSDKFEAGDYKWKFSIYPAGNKRRDRQGHISIYLALVDTSSLPAGWEVNVIFNFFAYDQFRDKYFSFQDGRVVRFHAMKTEWGIANFINLQDFNNPANGYLVDDTCVFGVEVFVVKSTRKGECLSMIEPITCYHTWKVIYFSSLATEHCDSETFITEDYKWKLRFYPNGNGDGKGNSISLFLSLDDSTLPPDTKLFVKFILRAVDQINGKHLEFESDNIFSPSCLVWGSQEFISLAKLNDPREGFLVDNTCIVEAQVTLHGLVNTVS